MIAIEPFDARQLLSFKDLELRVCAVSHKCIVVQLGSSDENTDGQVRDQHEKYGVAIEQHDCVEDREDERIAHLDEAYKVTGPLIIKLVRVVADVFHDGEPRLKPGQDGQVHG